MPAFSVLCLSQESGRRASARRKDSSQPKDLGWLDLCDKHRDEGRSALDQASRPCGVALA
ncbi:hypothetical protein BS627_15095 [Agrobacterium salinitolerans]|nr:hypothetical protein BS627_15095 [Agrobacterium salinitolerans]PNQ22463.1 hypothetical protein C2E26_15370 [Rhizobium sp. YIC5082]